MSNTRVVRKRSKRAVAARLASLQARRAGWVRHIQTLGAFPLDQLMPYERGQLNYAKRQVEAIDLLILALSGH